MWAALLLATAAVPADLDAAARADRAQFPRQTWGYYYYLTTATAPEERQEELAAAMGIVVCSTSSAVVIERHKPAQVAEGLYRIDLRELEWDWRDWHTVLKRYPYYDARGQGSGVRGREIKLPLVVRGDWLVVELTDNFASDAGYRLLYGSRSIPETRDEFLRFWDVSAEPEFRFGWIEGRSGVAIAGTRWLESRPTGNRGYAWGSRDSAEIDRQSDPLESPDGGFAHQAEEWIVGIPKWSLSGQRGALQAYLLSNGQGKRQDRAPADIVEDHSRFRGLPEIRNSGSCMNCHTRAGGIIAPKTNELRELIAAGVDLYAKKDKQEEIERFHLSDLQTEIDRNNEDFAAAVEAVNGLTPEESAAAFKASVRFYDQPLDLEQAARELYTTPEELRLALAYASAHYEDLGARLAGLTAERTIPREAWEESGWRQAAYYLEQWRAE